MIKRLTVFAALAVVALTREFDVLDSLGVSCASSEFSAEVGNDAEGATACSASSAYSSAGSSGSSSPSSRSRQPQQRPAPPPFTSQDYRNIPRR